MRKHKRKIIGLAVSVVIIVFFFKDFRVGLKDWKFGDGYHIGDMINFDFYFSLIPNDTLYVSGRPAALLQKYHYRIIDDEIVITSLDKKEKGFYYSK